MGLSTKGGNDNIQTPDGLAHAIVEHFAPFGKALEPCQGDGAFYRALVAAGCETTGIDIRDGHDFLAMPIDEDAASGYDWIITNPPWSQFRAFLKQAMRIADNIVFLDKLNAWSISSRLRDMEEAGFFFHEICLVPQPPKPWPQMGFQLAAVHIARDATGPVEAALGEPKITRLDWTPAKKTLPPPSFLA